MRSRIPELFILGIDGLDATQVIYSNYLPALKQLCEAGSEFGSIYSPDCEDGRYPGPHTWPAWTTIWTGMTEQEHGIHMPDFEMGLVQNIVDQPYKTIWEILDDVGYKCCLLNVQMTRGLKLKNGYNFRLGPSNYNNLFNLCEVLKRDLHELLISSEDMDVLAYYTIALDYWFHRNIHISKGLIFHLMDYLINWVQFYCPTREFIILSDHGFDPDSRRHTNEAFYYSRRNGQEIKNMALSGVAKLILSHFSPDLSSQLGTKIERDTFEYSSKELNDIYKLFKEMGYV